MVDSPSFAADPQPALVSSREIEVGKMAKETLIAFMQYSKGEGAKVYFRLTDGHRRQREEFMMKYQYWGTTYERLCKALRQELAEIIIRQKRELDEALQREGENLLRRQNISEAMFEASLREYLGDSVIQKLVTEANTYSPPQPQSLPVDRLYEIFAYRTGRARTLSSSIPIIEPEKKLVVLLILIADETYHKFEITDEQANWAFNHAKVERESSMVQRFASLQRDFDAACSAILR